MILHHGKIGPPLRLRFGPNLADVLAPDKQKILLSDIIPITGLVSADTGHEESTFLRLRLVKFKNFFMASLVSISTMFCTKRRKEGTKSIMQRNWKYLYPVAGFNKLNGGVNMHS